MEAGRTPDGRTVDLIDVFEGKGNGGGPSLPQGRKSLTLRLTFSLMDRTLRDEEVQAAVDKILAALKERCGAELRA